jgi:HPt (histidine-containing phosphotransfer) domain-containing protein
MCAERQQGRGRFNTMAGSLSNPVDYLLSELGSDPDMLPLVEAFVAELPHRLEAIRDSLRLEDFDALARLSHQLKGAAGSYGFPSITEASKRLEESVRMHADLETISQDLSELADLCGRATASSP